MIMKWYLVKKLRWVFIWKSNGSSRIFHLLLRWLLLVLLVLLLSNESPSKLLPVSGLVVLKPVENVLTFNPPIKGKMGSYLLNLRRIWSPYPTPIHLFQDRSPQFSSRRCFLLDICGNKDLFQCIQLFASMMVNCISFEFSICFKILGAKLFPHLGWYCIILYSKPGLEFRCLSIARCWMLLTLWLSQNGAILETIKLGHLWMS